MLRNWARLCVVVASLLGNFYAAAQSPDPALQKALSQSMASRSGTAIVLDAHSESRIIASYRLDVAARRVVYPGSSIKPFTLMALLQSGELDGQTALLCK